MHGKPDRDGNTITLFYRGDLAFCGGYQPLEMDEYVRLAAEAISRLRPDIILHRVTGDCPRSLLAAPDWNTRKSEVITGIDTYLESHDLRQGSKI